jgi:ubiquitin C-terminal hydrolase
MNFINDVNEMDNEYAIMFRSIYDTKIKALSFIIRKYMSLKPSYCLGTSEDASEFLTLILDDINAETQKINYETNIFHLSTGEESKVNCTENILFLEFKPTLMESLVDYLIEKSDDVIFRKIITKLGSLMILSVNRFKNVYEDERVNLVKINDEIEILQTINMKDCETDIPMQLISFIVHYGTIDGGHYVSFRKIENKWYLLNDDTFSETENPDYSHAYILFYERII